MSHTDLTQTGGAPAIARTGWLRRWLPPSATGLILLAMLCVAILRTWVMPMRSSFWIDEIGTVFVTSHNSGDPSLLAVPQVPASLYYVLPKELASLLGGSEVVYRIPSLLAMGAAFLLIGLLARRLIHPEAAWFAVFACFCLREINFQAADARPYALGTFVACAGLWCLIRWFDHARQLDAVLFAICGALLWRIHLVYWPFYLVFAGYAAVRLWRRETKVRPVAVLLVFGAVAVSLIPVALLALAINRNAQAHVVSEMPSGSDLLDVVKPKLVLGMLAGGVILSRWFHWPRVEQPVAVSSWILMLAWWLCLPVTLFVFSHITGTSLFLMRYLYLALPGLILTIVGMLAAFVPIQHWRNLTLVLGAGVIVFCGHWRSIWPRHHNSDWRAAARSINAAHLGEDLPIICPSPFIESRPPVWMPDSGTAGFFYAHLSVYPVHGHAYPFPYAESPEVDAFATRLAEYDLPHAGRFLIYGGDRATKTWVSWFSARPELAGWTSRSLGNFGDVQAILLEPAGMMGRR